MTFYSLRYAKDILTQLGIRDCRYRRSRPIFTFNGFLADWIPLFVMLCMHTNTKGFLLYILLRYTKAWLAGDEKMFRYFHTKQKLAGRDSIAVTIINKRRFTHCNCHKTTKSAQTKFSRLDKIFLHSCVTKVICNNKCRRYISTFSQINQLLHVVINKTCIRVNYS